MKGTKAFKEIIETHLKTMGEQDENFAARLKDPKKNINDCLTYIFNTVKKMNVCGVAPDEVYSMAVHYYQEEDVKVGDKITGVQVVVNQHVELTPEEIEAAKAKAKKEVTDSLIAKEHSICFSARVNGERTETIEVNIMNFTVTQQYGMNNRFTEWHEYIMQLIKKNMRKIQQAAIEYENSQQNQAADAAA